MPASHKGSPTVSWWSLTHKTVLPHSEPFQRQRYRSFACPHRVVVAEHKSVLPDPLTTTEERFLFHKSGLSSGEELSSASHCHSPACIPVGILNAVAPTPDSQRFPRRTLQQGYTYVSSSYGKSAWKSNCKFSPT